jgi:hypothetical protein
MDRRTQTRVPSTVPVRVWGVSSKGTAFQDVVTARNLSQGGLLLEGLAKQVRPGDTLQVQHGDETASFLIVWVGWPGTRQDGQIGLCKLPTEPSLWNHFKLEHCAAFAAQG